MRETDLPSPGILNNSIQLRKHCAMAISACEVNLMRAGGATAQASAQVLYNFFSAARTAVNAFRDNVLPTVTAQTAPAGGATEITLTCSEGLNDKIIPAASAFVFAPAKTISGIRIDGTKLIITVTAAVANGNTVAYTQPTVNRLQDAAQNEMASFTAKTITVA